MQTDINSKLARYQFDSLAELARWVDTSPRTWASESSLKNAANSDWDLGLGYARAWELARDGWEEGARRVQEALRAFTPQTVSLATRTDFYGHMPHVPRYCAGAPDSMIRYHKSPNSGSGRVLTLYVNIAVMWYVPAECIANYGIAMAQYINQLEQEGTRIELYASTSSTFSNGGTQRQVWTWRIKSADQPLDLAVLAFAIGHPAMSRRLCFALIERGTARQQGNYGVPVNARISDYIDVPANAAVLNGMVKCDKFASTPQGALKYITEEIDRAIARVFNGTDEQEDI